MIRPAALAWLALAALAAPSHASAPDERLTAQREAAYASHDRALAREDAAAGDEDAASSAAKASRWHAWQSLRAAHRARTPPEAAPHGLPGLPQRPSSAE